MRELPLILLLCVSACSATAPPPATASGKAGECRDYAASLLSHTRHAAAAPLQTRQRRNIEVDYVIRCHRVHIYKLYSDAAQTPVDPHGEVTLNFHINANGDVTAIDIIKTNIHDRPFQDKLLAYLKQLKFNKARNAGIYAYTIAFSK